MSNLAGVVEKPNSIQAGVEVSELPTFHVMFQMQEPTEQPWGDVFRGRYTLPAIIEVVVGFEKNGVCLRVLFLEEQISSDHIRAIREAFAEIGRDRRDCWLPAFTICPMMFAASQGLDRSVGILMGAKHFSCQPNQIVNGNISAMGYALMTGWRPDIAVQLLVAGPAPESIRAALNLLAVHRAQHSDDPDLHQQECRDAVISILHSELDALP